MGITPHQRVLWGWVEDDEIKGAFCEHDADLGELAWTGGVVEGRLRRFYC